MNPQALRKQLAIIREMVIKYASANENDYSKPYSWQVLDDIIDAIDEGLAMLDS